MGASAIATATALGLALALALGMLEVGIAARVVVPLAM